MSTVRLRDVTPEDRDALFDLMREPDWLRMAAFTAQDPDDREAFDRWLDRLLEAPDITYRAITSDGELVGSISAFPMDDVVEVSYGVRVDRWGQGIASAALALLLEDVHIRPLYARAVSDNVASLRVLTKCGFVPVGTEMAFAPGRGAEVEETVLRLDA